jgi:sugar lactone lactonase YvrE
MSFTRYSVASTLTCQNMGRSRSGKLRASVSAGFRIVDDTCSTRVLEPYTSCTLGIVADAAGKGVLTLQAAPGGHVAITLASDARAMVSPATAQLRAGQHLRFTSDVAVDWSVSEGALGGSIDADGEYIASLTPGSYHVVATAHHDPQQRTTIPITVNAWVLELVAGALGGVGNADGVGEDARFWQPMGMVSDGQGNLYVADMGSNIIRKVEVATGTVTTLAGTPLLFGPDNGDGAAARFSEPTGLALDGAGRLFIADSANNTIRSLDLTSHHVSTLAGSGIGGLQDSTQGWEQFSVPIGLTYDAANTTLYVVDSGNDTVRKVALFGPGLRQAWVTTLRDASNMPLSVVYGWGIARDSSGTLYVGSAAFGTVSKIVPGSPPTVSDVNDGSGMAAQMHAALSVALDGTGRLYVAEDYPFPLDTFTPDAGTVTPLVDSNTVAESLAWGDDRLYFADESTVGAITATASPPAVTHIAGRAANFGSVNGPATAARFSAPSSIVFDGSAAYVIDTVTRSVRKVAWPSGDVSTLAVPKGSTSSGRQLYALTYDGNGSLYMIDEDQIPPLWSILKIDTASGAISTAFTSAKTLGRLTALAADGTGHLYVGSRNAILRLSLGGAPMQTVAGTPGMAGKSDTKDGRALFGSLQAFALDGAGTLYVLDDHAIRSVALTDGTTTTIAGVADQAGGLDGTSSSARFGWPTALAYDSDGTLFIVDTSYSTVRRLDVKTGDVMTWIGQPGVGIVRLGTLPAAVNQPGGIAVIAHGELLFTDRNENAVLHVR